MSKIIVNPDKGIGIISPHIYGSMLFTDRMCSMVDENLSTPNIKGIRLDLIKEIKRAHIGMIQWPGGDGWEYYRWRDGIGPKKQRPKRRSTYPLNIPGDLMFGTPDDNSLGTDEFLALCELTGVEPYMGASVCYGNAGDFHDHIEYCNCPYETELSSMRKANGHEKPYGVRYWCVNNQGEYITTEEYSGVLRQYYGFIPSFDIDPVRVARIDGKDGTKRFFRNWRERGEYKWFDYVPAEWNYLNPRIDILTYLRYGTIGPCIDFTREQWYKAMAYGTGFQLWIDEKRKEFKESFNPGMGIGLNEWGCMHEETYVKLTGSLKQKDTLRDSLAAAISLNIFNNNCDFVRFACLGDMINCIHHLFEISGDNIVATPTSLVYELYAPHHNGRCIDTRIETSLIGKIGSDVTSTISGEEMVVSVPSLNASSSIKDDILTITVVNTDIENDVESQIEVMNAKISEGSAMILYNDDPAAFNSFSEPHRVYLKVGNEINTANASNGCKSIIYRFPSHSVTRLTFKIS